MFFYEPSQWQRPFSKIHKRINAFAMRLSSYKRINTMILEHPACQCVCSFSTDLKCSMQCGNIYINYTFIPEFTDETCERSIYLQSILHPLIY
jgi:hypothetical protein